MLHVYWDFVYKTACVIPMLIFLNITDDIEDNILDINKIKTKTNTETNKNETF